MGLLLKESNWRRAQSSILYITKISKPHKQLRIDKMSLRESEHLHGQLPFFGHHRKVLV